MVSQILTSNAIVFEMSWTFAGGTAYWPSILEQLLTTNHGFEVLFLTYMYFRVAFFFSKKLTGHM